jgi:chitodextrinase
MRSARRLGRTTVLAVAAATVMATVLAPTAPASAAYTPPLRDGSSSLLAAPSCWGIKQSLPASTDGIYWLQTSTLVAPEQFYCDMTTDGGGWVLVGRGRDNWTWAQAGQGTPGQVRNTPSGTAAFAPATLPAATIDGLMDGARVDALTDGIRVRRTTNAAGTTTQEMRLKTSTTGPWNWTVGGGILLSSVTIDGSTYGGGNTQSWTVDNSYRRLASGKQANHNYRMGWGFGSNIRGSNSPTSYLWSYTTEATALPFTQVFIRPQLATSTFATIPDVGLPATTVRPMVKSETVNTTPWGVTGIVGGYKNELTLEVEDFAFIGRTAYVGGWFEFVQKGPNPAPEDKIAQPYLAAFNMDTGEWIPSFRPVLNGPVWDLLATPDGKLIVGGEFSSVNGAADTSGIAALDASGNLVSGWRTSVTNPTATNAVGPQVKSLDFQDGFIYLGGRFTRITGGSTLGTQITVGRAARVRLSDGRPDGTWKPTFDGAIVELDASDAGDRVNAVGYFNSVNSVASPRFAAVTTAAGAAIVPGLAPFVPSTGSGTKDYQQIVKEYDDAVWVGGSQHILSKYNKADNARLTSSITRQGGDFQAMEIIDGVVYAACHCGDWEYTGTYNYSSPVTTASRPSSIQYIGAWDAATGEFLEGFYPSALDARAGIGPFALAVDPDKCLWFGGDMKQGSWTGTAYQWLGGFGKFCQRDAAAPSTPTNLTATRTGGDVRLAWGASTDASTFSYQILRDDRVIATVPSNTRTFTTPELPANVKYFVRAVDTVGNSSATTPALSVSLPDVEAPTAPVGLAVSGSTVSSVSLSWSAASDNVAVTSYRVYRNGADVSGPITALTFTDAGLAPSTSSTYEVRAFDAAGNQGPAASVGGSSLADTTAPSVPGAATVSGETPSKLTLTWPASTDDVAVTGYRVYRDGTDVSGVLAGMSFTDTGLTAGTTYTYRVRATDAAGNDSGLSDPVDGTTLPTVVEPTPLYSDTWTQADGSPWAAQWTTSNANGTATVASGAGRLAYSDVAGAYSRAQLTGVAPVADAGVLFSYQWDSTAARSFVDIGLRGSGTWQNGYRLRNGYYLELSSTSSTVTVARNVNGVVTTLATVPNAQTVGTGKQWVRYQVVGSTIRFRTWADGADEPTGWTWSGTDTSVSAPGQFFISMVRSGTNVGAKAIALDDLTLAPVTP